jgi:hypothetical protein
LTDRLGVELAGAELALPLASRRYVMSAFAGMKEGGGFEQCPPGNHIGWLIQAIDLGSQSGHFGVQRKIALQWEIAKLMGNGNPYVVGKWVTASLNRKSVLRPLLESWRSHPLSTEEIINFSWDPYLSTPCLINVGQREGDEGPKSYVIGISAIPGEMEAPVRVNPIIVFDLNDPDQTIFDAISPGLKSIIAQSPEFGTSGLQLPTTNALPAHQFGGEVEGIV